MYPPPIQYFPTAIPFPLLLSFRLELVQVFVICRPLFPFVLPHPLHHPLQTKHAEQDVHRPHDEHDPRRQYDEEAIEEAAGGGGVFGLIQGPDHDCLLEADQGEEDVQDSPRYPVDQGKGRGPRGRLVGSVLEDGEQRREFHQDEQ